MDDPHMQVGQIRESLKGERIVIVAMDGDTLTHVTSNGFTIYNLAINDVNGEYPIVIGTASID